MKRLLGFLKRMIVWVLCLTTASMVTWGYRAWATPKPDRVIATNYTTFPGIKSPTSLAWDRDGKVDTTHPRYLILPPKFTREKSRQAVPDYYFQLLDTQTGKYSSPLQHYGGEFEYIRFVASDLLVMIDLFSVPNDTQECLVRVFDATKDRFVNEYRKQASGVWLNDDSTRLVFLLDHKTKPLQVEVAELLTGKRLVHHQFDDRVGLFGWEGMGQDKCSAADAIVSPDGKLLCLAEAWNKMERLSLQGIEVYDLDSGKLLRRLDEYYEIERYPHSNHEESEDFGAIQFQFLSPTHLRAYIRGRLHSQKEGWNNYLIVNSDHFGWDIHSGHATDEPELKWHDPNRGRSHSYEPFVLKVTQDRHLQLWRTFSKESSKPAFRVTDSDDQGISPYIIDPIPLTGYLKDARLSPDGTTILLTAEYIPLFPDWAMKPLSKLPKGLSTWIVSIPKERKSLFCWHWPTDTLHEYSIEDVGEFVALQPNRCITSKRNQATGWFELLIWKLPFPAPPSTLISFFIFLLTLLLTPLALRYLKKRPNLRHTIPS